jgi:hypothetical protein
MQEQIDTSMSLEEAQEIMAKVPAEVGDVLTVTFFTTDEMKEALKKFSGQESIPDVLGEKGLRIISKGKTFYRAEWIGRKPARGSFEKYEIEKGYKLHSRGDRKVVTLGIPQEDEKK